MIGIHLHPAAIAASLSTGQSQATRSLVIELVAPSWLTVVLNLQVALILGKTLPPDLDRARVRDLDSDKPMNSQYG